MSPQEPQVLGGEPWSCEVCPGYVGRLPAVQEGASAYGARADGCLDVGFPEISNPTWEAAEVLTLAVNAKQSADAERARKKG